MSNFKYITKNDKMRDQFYQIPKQFMLESKYKKMKDSSKILYSILYSRTSLSVQNNWFDSEDRAYIICTYDEMQVLFGCSRDKVSSCIKDLKKFDLIKVDKIKNENNDTVNVIYIAHVETTRETLDALMEKHKSDYHALRNKNREYKREYNKKQSEIKKQKREKVESEKQTTIENTKSKILKLMKPSNSNGSLKNRLRVVRKSDYSNTELSYTDNSMYVCTSNEAKQISQDLLLELQRKASNKVDPGAWLNKTIKIQIEKGIYTLDAYKESVKEYGKQFRQASKTINDYNNKKIKKTSEIQPNKNIVEFLRNKKYANNNKKTKFHNFDETFTQYTQEELGEIIEKSQKAKFEVSKVNSEIANDDKFEKAYLSIVEREGIENVANWTNEFLIGKIKYEIAKLEL